MSHGTIGVRTVNINGGRYDCLAPTDGLGEVHTELVEANTNRLPGEGNIAGSVVMHVANECALTESTVSLNPGADGLPELARDRNEGLYLLQGFPVEAVAASSDHDTCLLTLRD